MQLTDHQIRQLLGRSKHTVPVADWYAGQRVLITGGGGSIGRAIAHALSGAQCEIVLMDRSETALMAAHLELHDCELCLADVTRPHRVRDAFRQHKPTTVFHAAAHKHVPFMEGNIEEAYDNNYGGTVNAMQAAMDAEVRTFCLISTDKAVEPSSVMGATKYMAEREVLRRSTSSGATKLCAVRFGNVLGSSGSLLEIWAGQVVRGEPLTVTHPAMTRYLMTMDEAAHLVLASSSIAESGDLFMLNMGEPVSIVHLARRFNSIHGRAEDEYVITGLRPGEKLTEKLYGDDEVVVPTCFASVNRIGKVKRADPAQ